MILKKKPKRKIDKNKIKECLKSIAIKGGEKILNAVCVAFINKVMGS